MTFFLSLLTSRLAGPVASVVALLLAVALGWQTVRVEGLKGRVEKAEAAATKYRDAYRSWRAYGEAEKAAYDASERLRAAEGRQAIAALSEASQACSVRVARARASGAAIAAIINKEPARDPDGCPRRALADPDVLRNALSPRSPVR